MMTARVKIRMKWLHLAQIESRRGNFNGAIECIRLANKHLNTLQYREVS